MLGNDKHATSLSLAAGALTGCAFLYPETWLSVGFAWCAVVSLCRLAQTKEVSYRHFFLYGITSHLIGFYWLPKTLSYFGGFHWSASLMLFLLYCAVSSIQFLFCFWLLPRLSFGFFESSRLAFPCAWFVAEFLTPRLFPWALVQTQIRWTSFSTLAEYVGVLPLSLLMFWWAELALLLLRRKEHKRFRLVLGGAGFSVLLLFFGFWRTKTVKRVEDTAATVTVGLIQGNLDAKEKGDVKYLDSNIERYQKLSMEAKDAGATLLFWPESVVNVWMPEKLKEVAGTEFDPFPGGHVSLLYGVLSYREQENAPKARELNRRKRHSAFNSAFGIDENGRVVGRYHKRILMPFGEYLPLEKQFPVLRQISPYSGDLDQGDLHELVVFSSDDPAKRIAMSVLICYEDLMPALGREAIQHGARLLANLTNDAWYGDTAAPYQHHLVASWRAIETRRYLVRVTNTGYTAVVDSLGRTVAGLPLFSERYLVTKVKLLDSITLYSRMGDSLSWAIAALVFSAVIAFRNKMKVVRN